MRLFHGSLSNGCQSFRAIRSLSRGLLMLFLLTGCQPGTVRDSPLRARDFHLTDVAKADIDLVAEVTLRQSHEYLRQLAAKLYRRNPAELSRWRPDGDIDAAVSQLLQEPGAALRAQWRGRRSAALIDLAFDVDYQGDRVAALIYGLRTMLADAYGGEREFYIAHQYDPQKIYYLARNIEIAAWRLRSRRDGRGRLCLLSTGPDAQGVVNTSFERLIGKLVALQDHFAQIVADSGNRRIKNVIQGVASAVFFPI